MKFRDLPSDDVQWNDAENSEVKVKITLENKNKNKNSKNKTQQRKTRSEVRLSDAGGNADRTAITSGNGNKHTASGRELSAPRMTNDAQGWKCFGCRRLR